MAMGRDGIKGGREQDEDWRKKKINKEESERERGRERERETGEKWGSNERGQPGAMVEV